VSLDINDPVNGQIVLGQIDLTTQDIGAMVHLGGGMVLFEIYDLNNSQSDVFFADMQTGQSLKQVTTTPSENERPVLEYDYMYHMGAATGTMAAPNGL
jgi:hypothetical protein